MSGIARLRPLMERFVKEGLPGCSCIVIRDNKLVDKQLVGYADLDEKKPITDETIYRVFSMTKVITCTAALMLFEKGLFLLNDPLGEYLPEFKSSQVHRYSANGELTVSPAARPIQVRDLFTMTSGLTYAGEDTETGRKSGEAMKRLASKENSGVPYTVRELSKALAQIPLAFDPGTHWKYSLSHDVLGALIEVLSGKSFGTFLKDEIFDPLGMADTFFRIPASKRHRLCSAYNLSPEGKLQKSSEWDDNKNEGDTYESGGGGLLSTLSDYSTFAHMLANGGELNGVRLIGRKTIELMATNHLGPVQLKDFNWPALAGYGYGLGVRTMIDRASGESNSSVGEFGWCGLLGTWVLIDPTERLSAVYMQQVLPNLEEYHQPRLRAVIYGAL